MAPARHHATAPNIHVFETIVLFTPRDPLCFLSNDALDGHIWVSPLNAFSLILNERINKAHLFFSGNQNEEDVDET